MRMITIMQIMNYNNLQRLVIRPIFGALASVAVVACGGGESSTSADRPSVVVTYSILGAVVADVVGDAADVNIN
jgi:ABC-type Zn uptake system ZnuABC Zn-binding protein ZnuA